MVILGVDPGLTKTGYGVLEVDKRAGDVRLKEAGIIRTEAKDQISKRLTKIFNIFSDIIREFNPDVLVLEKLYSHYKHPVTSILMGHARGVICLAAGSFGLRLVNYPSTRIKKAITGKGHASKTQMQGMIKTLLNMKDFPESVDVADALACALTYVNVELRRRCDIKNKR